MRYKKNQKHIKNISTVMLHFLNSFYMVAYYKSILIKESSLQISIIFKALELMKTLT